MDLNQCACSGKTLPKLAQPAVMAVLARRPAHGYAVLRELGKLGLFHGKCPDPTGIYRLLKSMEEKELLASDWDLADTGPARRKFALTRKGRACLQRWVKSLEEYERTVGELLAILRSPARA
jgi:DNA-binding PadR family transcriptional regulator